jgi:hypothetical protein
MIVDDGVNKGYRNFNKELICIIKKDLLCAIKTK